MCPARRPHLASGAKGHVKLKQSKADAQRVKEHVPELGVPDKAAAEVATNQAVLVALRGLDTVARRPILSRPPSGLQSR
eukprot:1925741-Alexandrium_andersonii.AAC.1